MLHLYVNSEVLSSLSHMVEFFRFSPVKSHADCFYQIAKMGCTLSSHNGLLRRHSDASSSRIFKVTNVDSSGVDRSPGYIEITPECLILHQRGKESVAWPLRGLRRYGFDADLFSFESGRRCPTGPGIYAFRCRRAEALFNLLQNSIVVAGQTDVASRRPVEQLWQRGVMQVGSGGAGGNVNPLMTFQPVAVVRPISSTHMTLNRFTTQQSLARLPDILAMSRQQRPGADDVVHYAELDLDRHVEEDDYQDDDDQDVFDTDDRGPASRFYVNMPHMGTHGATASAMSRNGNIGHGYANLDLIVGATGGSVTVPQPSSSVVKVNYVQLDLSTETVDATGQGSSPVASPTSMRTPSLPHHNELPRSSTGGGGGDSYTTIDFDRTRALNTISVDPAGSNDEGVRRTRHNSNIV
jgi:fibroblast growth factor receptor substrate 2